MTVAVGGYVSRTRTIKFSHKKHPISIVSVGDRVLLFVDGVDDGFYGIFSQ